MSPNPLDEKKAESPPPTHLEHVVSNDSSQAELGKTQPRPRFGIDAELAMVLERVRRSEPQTLLG